MKILENNLKESDLHEPKENKTSETEERIKRPNYKYPQQNLMISKISDFKAQREATSTSSRQEWLGR